MEVSLPQSTMFIIGVSDFLRNNALASAVIVFGGGAFAYFFFTKTMPGKKFMGFISLHLPAIKNLTIKVNSARFGRIYSSLLRSGVSVVDALSIISNTLTNHYYKEALQRGVDDVQKGVALSKIVSEYPKLFPVLVYQIIEVGEDTGKTEEVLLRMAEFYEEEVDQITKNLSSIIEPVLMVLIGGAVGFFAIAMLQPMYSVLDNIQ
jgi:type IV pilus assembly protein PilC